MKKLRLLITSQCERNCEGCCNKQYDLNTLEIEKDFSQYDMIMLTGGEPMLNIHKLIHIVCKIRPQNPTAKIILYTAMASGLLFFVLEFVDGLTFTLHEQSDVKEFLRIKKDLEFGGKSLRLNVFKEIELPEKINFDKWVVKKDMIWIENCPLPEDEVFKRYF